MTLAAPQTRSYADQYRLNPVDPDDRLSGGNHIAQREPHLRNEIGFQLVDGGGEGRFVGQ